VRHSVPPETLLNSSLSGRPPPTNTICAFLFCRRQDVRSPGVFRNDQHAYPRVDPSVRGCESALVFEMWSFPFRSSSISWPVKPRVPFFTPFEFTAPTNLIYLRRRDFLSVPGGGLEPAFCFPVLLGMGVSKPSGPPLAEFPHPSPRVMKSTGSLRGNDVHNGRAPLRVAGFPFERDAWLPRGELFLTVIFWNSVAPLSIWKSPARWRKRLLLLLL